MRVTLLQTDIHWAQPEKNINAAERLMASQPRADLYVLPEMWATGFATTPMEVAESESNSLALQWMKATAAENKCAISGSLAVRLADGTYRNRHYMALPDGQCHHYDKHHLFSYGHEDRYFTPGNSHTIVSYGGVDILLLTCYDLRFPLWSRYGIAGRFDMIVCAANWPDSRQQPWRVLTRARAIENQCYLVGVNRVGSDAFCHYVGESLVCDSRGDTLVEGGSEEQAISADIDFSCQKSARERFRVLDDRDNYKIVEQ